MLTVKKRYQLIHSFIAALQEDGVEINRVILFGSYARGLQHVNSDIDLAIWSPQFSEDRMEVKEQFRKILQKHFPVQLHPFPAHQTASENPFIAEVEKYGKEIMLTSMA